MKGTSSGNKVDGKSGTARHPVIDLLESAFKSSSGTVLINDMRVRDVATSVEHRCEFS